MTREDKITDRGFRHTPMIPGTYGGGVRAYESSAASGPHVWVLAECYADANNQTGHIEAMVHLPVEDARLFADDINRVCDRHYQTHSPEDERTINEWARARAESVVEVDPRGHEPLCPHTTHPYPATCEGCAQVRRVQDAVRDQIATDIEALADGPWGNLIETDTAARIARGGVTKEEFDAAKGPGKTDDDGKDVLYRRMEEYERAQYGWGNELLLDDYDEPTSPRKGPFPQAHEHEWVRGCLQTTCTDCLMVCRVCQAVQK